MCGWLGSVMRRGSTQGHQQHRQRCLLICKCDTPLCAGKPFRRKQSQSQPHFCYILLLSALQDPGERTHKNTKIELFWTALSSRNRLPSSWIMISFNCSVISIIVADLMAIMTSFSALHWLDRRQEFSRVDVKYFKQIRGRRAKVSFLHQGLSSVYLV